MDVTGDEAVQGATVYEVVVRFPVTPRENRSEEADHVVAYRMATHLERVADEVAATWPRRLPRKAHVRLSMMMRPRVDAPPPPPAKVRVAARDGSWWSGPINHDLGTQALTVSAYDRHGAPVVVTAVRTLGDDVAVVTLEPGADAEGPWRIVLEAVTVPSTAKGLDDDA